MGFFDDVAGAIGGAASAVGGAVSDAADAVGGAVQDAAAAVGGAVSDVLETAGNAIDDGLDAVADVVDDVPLVGPVLGEVLDWTGDVASSAFDLAGGVVDGAFGIVGGVLGGAIRVVGGGVGGLLEWDAEVFVRGWGDIAAGVFGGVVVILGEAVSFVQNVVPGLEGSARPLTAEERAALERVFRGSVALHNVRIVEGFAGLFSVNDRPFTLCNTIYMKDVDPAKEPDVLVHECVHVWQYQHTGARYTADALGAQWFVDDAYNWRLELQRGKTAWEQFNNEAQGQFFEDLWSLGEIVEPSATGNGAFFDADGVERVGRFRPDGGRGADHTQLANEAVARVRRAWVLRLSALL